MDNPNYTYFEEYFDELYKQYGGKYIAIKDCNVIGVYNDFDTALRTTAKTEELGTFLVQRCEKEPPAVYCNRNVSFRRA